MMEDLIEKRTKDENGLCILELKISKKDFFIAYDEIDIDSGYDFLKKYLVYKQDKGIPKELKTSYSDDEELITISTKLHYLEKDDDDDYI